MMQRVRRIGLGLFATLAIIGNAGQAPAAEADRFEVSSLKAVRPTIVALADALQKHDLKASKDAAEAYDSAWNGIETYINFRSKPTYDLLELNLQAGIDKGLESPNPDYAALTTQAQTLLAKYDEAIATVAKAPPVSPLFDEVARLRIVRAPLRQVVAALKAGNIEKAKKSFDEFDNNWDSIEDLVKQRSADSYTAIEKDMVQVDSALMPDKPDVTQVSSLVNEIMTKYNAIVGQITRDARAQK
jgi:hypothetical protein